jgi:hypothetical protein
MIIVATTMRGELNIAMNSEEGGGRWHCSSALIIPKRDQFHLEGFHGIEGRLGSGNDERYVTYITIWQTSLEKSTRAGQNYKNRCVKILSLAFLLA